MASFASVSAVACVTTTPFHGSPIAPAAAYVHLRARKVMPGSMRLLVWASVADEGAEQTAPKWFIDSQIAVMKRFDAMETSFSERFDVVEKRFNVVEKRFDVVEKRFDVVEKRFSGLDHKIGVLVESSVRDEAGKMFGTHYAKQFTAKSIVDLVTLLPEGFLYRNSPRSVMGDKHLVVGLISRKVAKVLIDEDIPLKLLRAFHASARGKKDVADYPMDWWTADGELDLSAFGRFLGAMSSKNQALQRGLVKLKEVLAMSKVAQVDELLHCASAGLMCLLFVSLPNLQSSDTVASICLPMEVIEFDLKGSIDSFDPKWSIRVDIGEVKSSIDYATAVPQLGVRLKAFECLISMIAGRDLEYTLVGRLFLSRHLVGVGADVVDPLQRQLAFKKWGFSLYVHRV